MNYYNDNDPTKAAWLRQLIEDRLIPYGEVDERSIADVQPSDLAGFTSHHFFADIGGWALARTGPTRGRSRLRAALVNRSARPGSGSPRKIHAIFGPNSTA